MLYFDFENHLPSFGILKYNNTVQEALEEYYCSWNKNDTMKKIYLILTLLLFSVCCFSQSRYVSQTTKKIVYVIIL